MMQSRLAATKINRVFNVIASSENQFVTCRRLAYGQAAVRPEGKDDASEAAKPASSTNQSEFKISKEDDDSYVPRKPPHPSGPSSKLQGNGVNQPAEPVTQQKRPSSSSSTTPAPAEAKVPDVSCAGLDGSPLSGPKDNKDSRRTRKETEEDDKEYFEHHKASPLSEIQIADTRKPITRATDGTADSYAADYGSKVVLWRPEQLDTAEDSLRRAREIWTTNAMRGDPDSPHGRVLRALRGEYW